MKFFEEKSSYNNDNTNFIFKAVVNIYFNTNVKAKAIPLQAWTGPEGSRRLRLPYFKTIGT
jgi:hypothetical protein